MKNYWYSNLPTGKTQDTTQVGAGDTGIYHLKEHLYPSLERVVQSNVGFGVARVIENAVDVGKLTPVYVFP